MNIEIVEPARTVQVVDEFDVVVVGGGVAGAAAAIAAARNGARVALIEKENALGGLATLGLVVIYLPLCDGKGRQVIGGLGEELLKLSVRFGGEAIPDCWTRPASREERIEKRYRVTFNAAGFAIALEELLLQLSITLMFDTRFCDVVMDDGHITAVIVENKSGRLAVGCKTVVDASGDADVCHRAGEETVSLDTNRRSGWYFAAGNGKIEIRYPGDPYWLEVPEGKRTYRGDKWEDVSEMSIQSRLLIKEDIQKLRAERGDDSLIPLIIPTLPQFRMTRRLKGAFELDEDDEGQVFEDTVGMTGDWRKPGPVFCIPFRSLVGVKTDNLITAGRCISVTTSAWEITRAIPACVVTGEAAGTAAAVATGLQGRFSELCVAELQERLREQGVILPE